jgi:hypothetical protein
MNIIQPLQQQYCKLKQNHNEGKYFSSEAGRFHIWGRSGTLRPVGLIAPIFQKKTVYYIWGNGNDVSC